MVRKYVLAFLGGFLFAAALCAQTKTAPALSEKQKTDFFKAQSELNQAQLALERTKEFQVHSQKAQAFQDIINGLIKACGSDFQLGLGKDGDPACMPKPEPAKAEPKK